MSSEAVRSSIRTAWPLVMPTLPLFETINVALDPAAPTLPDVWASLVFNSTGTFAQTMGSRPWLEEQGLASITILSMFGAGDGPGVVAATEAVKAWTGWISPDRSVWVHAPGAPRAPEEATLGRWSILVVDLDYRYQHRG